MLSRPGARCRRRSAATWPAAAAPAAGRPVGVPTRPGDRGGEGLGQCRTSTNNNHDPNHDNHNATIYDIHTIVNNNDNNVEHENWYDIVWGSVNTPYDYDD